MLVVSHCASGQAGGAGSIPLRLFSRLRARGVDVVFLTHDSARAELAALLPASDFERVIFAPGLRGLGRLFTAGERLPATLRTLTSAVTRLERQVALVPVARRVVRARAIDVVHQPVGVSPVIPAPLIRLGAPVVTGPLNAGMEPPPAFRRRDSAIAALVKAARPAVASVMNRLIRGRSAADVVLVANARTRSLLPAPVARRAIQMPDIGVLLDECPAPGERPPAPGPVRFLFAGPLVSGKAVDILLEAFALVRETVAARLEIIGDGPEVDRLAVRAGWLGRGDVSLSGWLDHRECLRRITRCDVFVAPGLRESGGVAVLEAMACARPVIATAWGGHLATVDESTGVLVGVSSRAAMIRELAAAMTRLADDPDLRERLGRAGRRRVEARYDWDVLVEGVLRAYDQALDGAAPVRATRDLTHRRG